MIFLDQDSVLFVHRTLSEQFGGVPGVRDRELLASALAQPRQSYGGMYLHQTVFAMAAAYAFHIISDRPFVSGNRRTAAACAAVFLELNSWELRCDPHILFRAVVSTGEGLMSEGTLARFLEMNCARLTDVELTAHGAGGS